MAISIPEALKLTLIGSLTAAAAFVGSSALIGNPIGLPDFGADSAVAAPLSSEEQADFIAAKATEANYEELSESEQENWDTVASVIYGKLGAYDLSFELTDEESKNCAWAQYQLPGGCYHWGGKYDTMIFVSPGVNSIDADFIAYHEYAHHLQRTEGGNRFVEDLECDANLRALELKGSWAGGYQRVCLDLGYTDGEISLANLPVLEAEYAASH